MSPQPAEPKDHQNGDDEILADLFDTLLQEILEGNTPDLSNYLNDRPDLHDRKAQTWALACSVAGRREPSRPVLGGYEILRELGHGGMGTVYLARHQALQRDVAIKVLPHSLAMSPRAKQRFLEEARALAQLRHDHVVHVHRIIDHAEMLAFEMEFIDGPSLQRVIQELRQQPKPHSAQALAKVLGRTPQELGSQNIAEWLVRIGIRIARALAEVHRHGLVHRDVKPSNILLRMDGRPVLADFGLARIHDLDATQVTAFAGTPMYAAPERLRDGDAGTNARADIYSLGITMYEALTLSPPFAGSTTHEVLRRIESGHLPPLRQIAPHVSRDLETVIGKATEVDPRHRYADADAFAEDLERLLCLQPILARPAGPLRTAGKFLRRNRRLVTAALAGALVVLGIAAPMFVHASTLAGSRAQALAVMHEARTQVLSAESLHAAATGAFAGSSRQPLRPPSAIKAQIDSLGIAENLYDAALRADPTAEMARLERSVIATAILLRKAVEHGSSTGLEAQLAGLPPLAQRLARWLAEHLGTPGPMPRLSEEIAAAAATDRFATGLLGFLLGDEATSHACWHRLDSELSNSLLDACQALQLAGQGFSERAYARLFHAVREFAKVPSLTLALADSALAMGDIELAEQWLREIPDSGDHLIAQSRRQLLAADLLTANGQYEQAARAYRELFRADQTDPQPVQRLATLAIAQGDHATGRRILHTMLVRWPDLAATRLELARIALLTRRLPDYLGQVRHVLAQDLHTHGRSSANHLAEILRLGGLDRLRAELLADEPSRIGSFARGGALPLIAWMQPRHIAAIETGAHLLAGFDRLTEAARNGELREIGIVLRNLWLATLRFPALLLQFPIEVQATTLLLPPLSAGAPLDYLTHQLMPFMSTLGAPVRRVFDAPLFSVTNSELHAFASAIAIADDTDGDTLADVCIASLPAVGDLTIGCVEVRSLQDGSLLRTLRSDNDELMFGRSLTVLGDIDGDQCNDLLVGAPRGRAGSGTTGEVQLRSGRTGEVLWRVAHEPSSFGVTAQRLADMNGDGLDDLVVGASPDSLSVRLRGRAFVLSGADGSLLREVEASRGGVWFGAVAANAGDVDADGKDDILVGGNYGGAPGLVVLFGGGSGLPLWTVGDDSLTTDYGQAVAGVGDVDGDGTPDVTVAAPALSSRGKDPGRVQVLSGRTGKVMLELVGERPGDGFGIALCPVRDWIGSTGISLAVTARRGGPVGTGYVRVFSLRDGSPQQTFSGGPTVALIGRSLAALPKSPDSRFPTMLVPISQRNYIDRMYRMNFAQTLPPELPAHRPH